MRRSPLCAVLVLALAAPAHAIVLSEDALEETSTEVGVITRTFSFSLIGDPLDDPVGIGLLDFRFYFAEKTPRFTLVIHDQLTTRIQSQDLLGVGFFGRGLAPPRLLPLQQDIEDGATFAIRNVTDWLYAAYTGETMTVTAGRQPVTFGRGKLWRPYDLIGTFALTEVDTEYKPGADALRVDWSPNAETTLSLVAATGELEDDEDLDASRQGTSIVARGKRSFDGGEAGVFGGYVRGDAVAGADAVYDVGSFEVYAEATVTRPSDDSLVAPEVDSGDFAAKAIAGATFRPTSKLVVAPELMYNGFGAADEADYLGIVLSDRVAVGEQIFFGRYYAGATADWEAHPLLHVVGATLFNVGDTSALMSGGVSYSFSDNVAALLGGYAPIGDDTSEYGSYPYFLYFELKAAL